MQADKIPTRSLTLALGLLVGMGPAAVDLYLVAFPSMAAELAAPETDIQTSLGVFFLGMVLTMLISGPFSDRYGRRVFLIGGTTIFVGTSIWLSQVDSANELILWRFIQALGVGAATMSARAIVRDVTTPALRARMMALVGLVMAIIPITAPLMGVVIFKTLGWRAIFLSLAVYGVIGLITIWRLIPETSHSESSVTSLRAAFLGYPRMFRSMRAMLILVTGNASLGGLFAYISESPFILIDYYGFPEIGFGLLFGGNAFGIMVASYLNSRQVMRYGAQRITVWASYSAFIGGMGMLIVSYFQLGFWAFTFALFLAIWVIGVLQGNGLARVMSLYPRNAAAITALFGAGGFLAGAMSNWLVRSLHDGSLAALSITLALTGSLTCSAALLERRRFPET